MLGENEKAYKVLCILSPSTGCAGTKQKNIIISMIVVIFSFQSHHPFTRALKFSCNIDQPHFINSSIFSIRYLSLHKFLRKSIYMKDKLPRVCVGIFLAEKHGGFSVIWSATWFCDTSSHQCCSETPQSIRMSLKQMVHLNRYIGMYIYKQTCTDGLEGCSHSSIKPMMFTC